MSLSIQERNKALVLEAFDVLFNKRDYAAAEKYWSPHYVQHSAHIEPGREGLFDLIKNTPSTLRYEPGLILAGASGSWFMAVSARLVIPLIGLRSIFYACKTVF